MFEEGDLVRITTPYVENQFGIVIGPKDHPFVDDVFAVLVEVEDKNTKTRHFRASSLEKLSHG